MREELKGGTGELADFFEPAIADSRVKIILPGNPVKNIREALIWSIKGFKVGILIDSAYYFESLNYSRPLEKWLYKMIRRGTIQVSSFILFSYYGARFDSAKKCKMVNTYSKRTEYFLKNQHRLKPISERKFDFAFIGRFEREKGIERFIQLAKTHSNFKFIIAGSGSLEFLVRDVVNSRENIERTLFHGNEDAFEFYNDVKTVVITSLQEGCSLVSKEALTMGCNVCSVELKGNGPLELASGFNKSYEIDSSNELPITVSEDLSYINKLQKIFDRKVIMKDLKLFLENLNNEQ